MALNSINTNQAALQAQSNIGRASNQASASIARLSSGNRITRAADDVASVSAGTSLRTNVTTLRTALVNTSQGQSLLQVADGALTQVVDILQRQKAISVQAGSGSLTSTERTFLNQEFQQLTQEIDRLVGQTNFNGVTLLDGSLSETVSVEGNADASTSASASISFNTNLAAGDDLVFRDTSNGTTTTVALATAGGTIADSIDNLVNQLNASTDAVVSSATYSRSGNSLIITSDNGGVQGQTLAIDAANSTALDGSGTGRGVVNGGGASASISIFDPATGINAADTTSSVVAAAATPGEPIAAGAALATVDGVELLGSPLSAGDSLEDIVNNINANSSVSGFEARIVGSSGNYNIQVETSTVDTDVTDGYNTASTLTVALTATVDGSVTANGGAATVSQVFSLEGATDAGIGKGDTVGIGTIGDNIITNQNQQQSEVTIAFPEIADADLNDPTNFGNATTPRFSVGGVTISFSATGDGPGEARIGSTLEETLDNAVAAFNSYEGTASENYALDQVEAYRDGTDIKIRTVNVGAARDLAGNVLTVTPSTSLPTGSSVSGTGQLNTGATGGIDTSGITNSDFIGNIQGFEATFTGTTDTVDLSVEVGDVTYAASSVNVNNTTDSTIRLTSDDGGYFDIQLAGNRGESVASQSDADLVADRLNGAFSSITFSQEREVTSYSGNKTIDDVGSLIGSSVDIQLSNFDNVRIEQIRVNAPEGISENGSIEITLNGEVYSASPDLTAQLGGNQTYRLTSTSDANSYIDFTTGDSALAFDTLDKAQALEQGLRDAFGVSDDSAAVSFQVGVTTSDALNISVDNVSTREIFDGQELDVLTQESAAAAADALDLAIDAVTAVRAEVGALQSRFDFAAANVESSITNQDAARGVLLDTDIAAESTAFSQAQVKLQAGISVLAQANLLPQNLLKLIG